MMLMTRENQALTSELMVVEEEDNAREIGSWMMSVTMIIIVMMILMTVTIVLMS